MVDLGTHGYPLWRGVEVDDPHLLVMGPLDDPPTIGPALLHGQRRRAPDTIPVDVIDRDGALVLGRISDPVVMLLFRPERVEAIGRG